MNLRRSRAARMLAFCLLILAASPVTAPFSTLDLGDVTPGSPFQDTMVKQKGSDQLHVCVAVNLEDASDVLDPEHVTGHGRCANHAFVQLLIVPLRI